MLLPKHQVEPEAYCSELGQTREGKPFVGN